MFLSPEQVKTSLASVGYIADEVTSTVIYLACRLQRPILAEGPAGSGKTELAYAVAKANKVEVERLQCFEGIDDEKAIGKFDEALQRLALELQSKSGEFSWEAAKEQLHGVKFFTAGPLLRALQQQRSCVLLIDELDKVDHSFQAMLLRGPLGLAAQHPQVGYHPGPKYSLRSAYVE